MPDNEIRDQLAAIIHAAVCYDGWEECREYEGRCIRAAEQQLERGVRPPARVIEAAEECAALPVGTIVLDKFGAGCTRVHRDPLIGWVRASSALRSRMGHQQHAPWLPATVLYEPEEGRDA